MTDEERKDEIIRNAASDYNRPPATPREEMWNAIEAARANSGPRLHVAAGGARQLNGDVDLSRRRFAPRFWLGAAAAAMLLVAAGVGIGRWTSTPNESRRAGAQSTANPKEPVAVAEGPSLGAPDSGEQAAAQSSGSRSGLSTGRAVARESGVKPRTREDIRRSPNIIGTRPLRLATRQDNSASEHNGFATTSATAVSYQVATQRHLENAEALLTSFSLEGRDPKMDAQFAGWAKGLLSNTRLLLDSPAGDDPRRAKLLEDLELVLAQIVQLSPNAPAQDRELIQGSIQDGHVMTRLRSAIPAEPRGIQEK